ncbi:MAG TPA: hypothetical protein VJO13_05235 [Ktedonobacterales bacterium]|nr:hypothetical protein [Ktedonobacterales bacterium]
MATTSEDQFNALLAMGPSQFRAAWRRGRITQWLGLGISWGWIGFLVFLIWYGVLLPVDVFPDAFSAAIFVSVFFVLSLLSVLLIVAFAPSQARWLGVHIVRNALLEGNEAIAPLAMQPFELTVKQSADLGTARFPLQFPRASRVGIVLAVATLLFFLVLTSLYIVALRRAPAVSYTTRDAFGILQLSMFIFTCDMIVTLFAGPQILSYGWGAFLPLPRQRLLAVDEWGIRWQPRGRRRIEKTLAWHDVRAFCVHRHKPGFSSWTAYTYMLMSDTETFVWTIPANATSDARDASGVLAQVAIARTNCPLRDVTISADLLSAWETSASSKPGANPNDGEPRRSLLAALTAVRESAPRQPVPLRPVRFSSRCYWLNALMMVVVILSLCGGWVFAHLQAEAYLRSWPARIAAETPLFSDSLASNTNGWPLRQAVPDKDFTALEFSHGGYTMIGSVDHVVWPGARYADVALAVTATLGEGEYSDDAYARLVAHVGDTKPDTGYTNEIALNVDLHNGTWSFFHERTPTEDDQNAWSFLTDDKTSAAIHTGIGVPNHLMLVVIGTMCYAYANGQLLGSVHDPYAFPPAPQSGYMGLQVLTFAPITFNDFAIYPAPPPYQPLFHG